MQELPTDPFEKCIPLPEELKKYGFAQRGGRFILTKPILGGEFLVTVDVGKTVKTTTVERETGDPYVLHLIPEAQGTFVGQVRAEYFALLEEIAARCFAKCGFRGSLTRDICDEVRRIYGVEPEYLWEKFPEDAVLRRKDTGKWFGALLTVSAKKLGRAEDAVLEILDIRASEEEIAALSDGVRYFPGYHMNKRHWLTVVLDGSVPQMEILMRIAKSYALAK